MKIYIIFIELIIFFRFNAYSEMNNTPNSGNTNSATDEAWKRRNTTEDRHIIRQGPPKQPEVPSPTSQHHHINRCVFLILFLYSYLCECWLLTLSYFLFKN